MSDPRFPCVVNPHAPDNCTPILACQEPAALSCTARGCVCQPAPPPVEKCAFTVTYPVNDPGTVLVSAPSDACAAGMELAVAALLARLLAGK